MMDSNDLADLVPQLRAEKDTRLAEEEMRKVDGKDRGEDLRDGATLLRGDMKSTLEDLRSNRELDAADRATQRRLEARQLRAEVTDKLKLHAADRKNATTLWRAAFGRRG